MGDDTTGVGLADILQRLAGLESEVAELKRRTESPYLNAHPPDNDLEVQKVAHLASIAENLRRLADAHGPPPSDKATSRDVANLLGCTTTWVADMVRQGIIPKNCLVPGTGTGKPWKFYRALIEKWIESR